MITFTLDLEDHRSSDKFEKRYPFIVREILEILEQNSVKGTFFTVGLVARSDSELIKEISSQGHELAFHSFRHKQLHDENRKQLLEETSTGKKELEDISGQEVIGYRAPVFSLTRNTLWVLDILQEVGFKYSSSVLPAKNPLNGFEPAPKTPFYWPNGLLEIPVPVAKIGPLVMPFLGGVYLRYLPKPVLKYLISNNNSESLWTYCHPYDFDSSEPFFTIEGASILTSLILWFNRSNTREKIEFLLSLSKAESKAMTFAEQYNNKVFEGYPVFEI